MLIVSFYSELPVNIKITFLFFPPQTIIYSIYCTLKALNIPSFLVGELCELIVSFGAITLSLKEKWASFS